ncbi:hypothetical protein Sar04_01700 [Salinispora arenicola]|uniref:Uncharacterized protein n=1 Tax=Salinispora arenicola TaxID=168697 RepID=A0ABQ4JKB1_SALAC|nr:hypothetical protein Sar04_01700 [Salinispora arenicola]
MTHLAGHPRLTLPLSAASPPPTAGPMGRYRSAVVIHRAHRITVRLACANFTGLVSADLS